MKRVVVVGTVGIPACYGGFESLVENLTKYSHEDVKYTVFCSSKNYDTRSEKHNGADLVYIDLKANGIQSVLYDIVSMARSIFIRPDVVLILGVSGCLFLPFFKIFSNAKIVTNIDGLEWRREKWGWLAKKFLKISELVAVRCSDEIISDNKAIAEYVESEYQLDSKVIAYGGDHVLSKPVDCVKPEDYYFGLCRIEPENNVAMILEAFSKSKQKLVFIGNWDNSDYGRALKSEFGIFENIDLRDPIYDLDLLFNFRSSCKAYIHGHSAGGTNPSLVEAMHFAKPVLAFNCNFNRFTTENKATYFSNANDLLGVLGTNEESLVDSGKAMKEIANRRYTWKVVVGQYESSY